MERVKYLWAEGQEVFEWKLRRAKPHNADDKESQKTEIVRVKTQSKPILATGFHSGVGNLVNHMFAWTEQSLCASGNEDTAENPDDVEAASLARAERSEKLDAQTKEAAEIKVVVDIPVSPQATPSGHDEAPRIAYAVQLRPPSDVGGRRWRQGKQRL